MPVGTILVAWGTGAVLYLVLAGQVSADEIVAAIGLGGGATGWYALARRCSPRRFVFSNDHVRPWLRAVGALAPATVRTAGVLLRVAITGGAPGKAVEQAFSTGPDAGPRDRARRASAVLAASLSPESFVVRAEVGRSEALVHAITPMPLRDPRWLV